jgi:hypothetical protein
MNVILRELLRASKDARQKRAVGWAKRSVPTNIYK